MLVKDATIFIYYLKNTIFKMDYKNEIEKDILSKVENGSYFFNSIHEIISQSKDNLLMAVSMENSEIGLTKEEIMYVAKYTDFKHLENVKFNNLSLIICRNKKEKLFFTKDEILDIVEKSDIHKKNDYNLSSFMYFFIYPDEVDFTIEDLKQLASKETKSTLENAMKNIKYALDHADSADNDTSKEYLRGICLLERMIIESTMIAGNGSAKKPKL